MKKKFEQQKIQLEIKLREKEEALRLQKEQIEAEMEKQMKSQLDKEK